VSALRVSFPGVLEDREGVALELDRQGVLHLEHLSERLSMSSYLSLLSLSDAELADVRVEALQPLALCFLDADSQRTELTVHGGLRFERDGLVVWLKTLESPRTRFAVLGSSGWGRIRPGAGVVQLAPRAQRPLLPWPRPLGPRLRVSALAERG